MKTIKILSLALIVTLSYIGLVCGGVYFCISSLLGLKIDMIIGLVIFYWFVYANALFSERLYYEN